MDALLAFWPGLQVLLGDMRPAVETHEMLYQVMQRHTFIPEAFTSDFQVFYSDLYRCQSITYQQIGDGSIITTMQKLPDFNCINVGTLQTRTNKLTF